MEKVFSPIPIDFSLPIVELVDLDFKAVFHETKLLLATYQVVLMYLICIRFIDTDFIICKIQVINTSLIKIETHHVYIEKNCKKYDHDHAKKLVECTLST